MHLPPLLEKCPDGRWLIRLNNSTHRKEQSGCPRFSYYALLAGLHDSTMDANSKAWYGTCAHLAWQKWALGDKVDDCIDAAVQKMLSVPCGDDWRSPSHLESMLLKWFAENPEKPDVILNSELTDSFKDAKPLVEYQWEFCIYEDSFAKVMLQGTIDLVYGVGDDLRKLKTRVRDYKTTADKDPEKKLEELLTSTQFLTYALAMDKCLDEKDCEFEIMGVFLRKDNKNIFQRSRILSFENEEGRRRLRQHEANLISFAKNLVDMLGVTVGNGHLLNLPPEDYRFCHSGWGCPYLGITNAIDEHKEMFISSEFERKVFNAHKHHEN